MSKGTTTTPRIVVAVFVVAAFSAFVLLICAEVATMANSTIHLPAIVHDTKAIAIQIMLIAPPLTNIVIWSSRGHRNGLKWNQLSTFIAYQIVGWFCYGVIFTLKEICYGLNDYSFCIAHEISIAYFGFAAEVFMMSSLLALEKMHMQLNGPQFKTRLFLHNYVNFLVIVGAVFMAMTAEWMGNYSYDGFSTNAILGSLILCIAAIMSTYGLGGILSNDSTWKFWQPFSGGLVFVLIQFVSWTCFTCSILLQGCFLISLVVVEVELFVGIMGIAGLLGIASQVGMIISLFVYIPPNTTRRHQLEEFANRNFEMLIPTLMVNLPPIAFLPYILPWLFVDSFTGNDVALYTVVHVGIQTFFSILLSHLLQVYYKINCTGAKCPIFYWLIPLAFAALPLVSCIVHYSLGHRAAFGTVLFAIPWYYYSITTMLGLPAQTGCRQDRSYITKSNAIMEATARYFSLHLIRDAPLDPKETYIFGFHPHGIVPMTVMWLQYTQQWRDLFPGIFACPLSASIVHYFPGMRDIIQWLGAREVTRTTFSNSLKEKQSIFVVPGGQAELIESRSRQMQVRVYTGHKGFLRMAYEHGAPLVPVLSFKEGEVLDNVQAPSIQKWFIKRFAFPCPYYPHGWTWLPIPNRIPLTIVVGKPIQVPLIEKPTIEQVNELHDKYFKQLEEMFHQQKDEADCSDYKLVLIPN